MSNTRWYDEFANVWREGCHQTDFEDSRKCECPKCWAEVAEYLGYKGVYLHSRCLINKIGARECGCDNCMEVLFDELP